jgi:hypothetical protein
MNWGENGEDMTQDYQQYFDEGDESTLVGLTIAKCMPAHCC